VSNRILSSRLNTDRILSEVTGNPVVRIPIIVSDRIPANSDGILAVCVGFRQNSMQSDRNPDHWIVRLGKLFDSLFLSDHVISIPFFSILSSLYKNLSFTCVDILILKIRILNISFASSKLSAMDEGQTRVLYPFRSFISIKIR
jgi:hypothetical protein